MGKVVDELDDRLGVAKGGRVFLDKIFPDHWSFMLGEIALYSFVVLMATGVFLALYFVPSTTQVIYHGTYAPLRGQRVSEAYESTVNISFAVRGGLLIRQMHHWAADIFVGSIIVHMARIFFTGAFRKPRELNWTIGTLMLIMAILEGFIGYSLPDDLISGTGLRIGYSIVESIPFVGSYLGTFLWGGQFPGNGSIDGRFYIIHVLIIPLAITGLLAAHLGLLVRQKHTQFKGEGRTETNVVGSPMFPTFMAKTTGFLFMVAGATALLGAFAQINPIWQFGSYDPSKISYAVQPDWYMGWLDGALRIMPSWEFAGWGHTIPLEVLLPAVVFPGLIFTIALIWPAIEHRWTGDNELHNLLDRPRDRPKRTAAGAAMLAPALHAVRRQLDRCAGQLLPRLAQLRAVGLPGPDRRRADRRRLRDVRDLQGDAGRARHRQAEAGGHRAPFRRGRVLDRDRGSPAGRPSARSSTPSPVPVRIDVAPLARRPYSEPTSESSPTGSRQVTR